MTATETSAITWGERQVAYTIRRSARRKKTVAVTVDPTGGVLLVAPEHFATSRLDAVVRRKAAWIVQRLLRVQSHEPPLSPREFVSGESVLYLGRHYRLKVHPNESGDEAAQRLAPRARAGGSAADHPGMYLRPASNFFEYRSSRLFQLSASRDGSIWTNERCSGWNPTTSSSHSKPPLGSLPTCTFRRMKYPRSSCHSATNDSR